jgi:hypothetical protein
MDDKEIEHNKTEYNKEKNIHDQKVLAILLSVLSENKNLTEHDNLQIKACLVEMFESYPNIEGIVKNLTPYQYEVVPVLIEALKQQSWEDTFIRLNSVAVLESIGDRRVINYLLNNILTNFNKKAVGYTPDLLVNIATREDAKTEKEIARAFRAYLNLHIHKIKTPPWGLDYDREVVSILDALRKLGALDSRLSPP